MWEHPEEVLDPETFDWENPGTALDPVFLRDATVTQDVSLTYGFSQTGDSAQGTSVFLQREEGGRYDNPDGTLSTGTWQITITTNLTTGDQTTDITSTFPEEIPTPAPDFGTEQAMEEGWFGPWTTATRADALDGIRIITGSELPNGIPLGTVVNDQGGNTCWHGTIPPGGMVGPVGTGPCVGLILVPADPSGTYHSYHFGPYVPLGNALALTGATRVRLIPGVGAGHYGLEVVPSEPFTAYLSGGGYSDGVQKLYEASQYLKSLGIPIGGYLPAASVHVDGSGQLYWTHLPTFTTRPYFTTSP